LRSKRDLENLGWPDEGKKGGFSLAVREDFKGGRRYKAHYVSFYRWFSERTTI